MDLEKQTEGEKDYSDTSGDVQALLHPQVGTSSADRVESLRAGGC